MALAESLWSPAAMPRNPFDPATSGYPRDMVGYGRNPPDPNWPGGARLALQIVVNYEEGGENSILHGDAGTEFFLTEHIVSAQKGVRNPTVESLWEYGSRVGFWRLWRLLSSRNLPVTCFGVTMAMGRNPEAVAAMREAGWEIATHGMRWNVAPAPDRSEAAERTEIKETLALHEALCGAPALGWYNRSSPATYRLLSEHGGLLYFADNYADELPFWADVAGKPELFVPYTLEANDMRFAVPMNFGDADQFFTYLRDTFDTLYQDGLEGRPRMMSVGLHGRLAGRPGRTTGLARFLDHVAKHDRVWTTTRADIARHWRSHFPPGDLRTHW
jgi:putative urate catabolism protein